MSGTGQLLQGRWLSTPSLSAPLSALGFRNPTAQVVKQQCAGNTGQSLWELVFPLPGHWATLPDGVCCSPPWGGHVGVVAAHPTSSPSPCYHLPLFTAWCTATGWQMWLCHTPWAAGSWMDTPATQHLDRWHGWSPVGLLNWGSQEGPSRGSSPIHVTPWKHQHGGFPKSPLFLQLKHLPADS